MVIRQARSLFLILTAVCGLVVVTACQFTSTANPRGNLLRTINGANVDGYVFSFDEDATRSTSSLTNPAVNDVVILAAGDNVVPLRYTTVRDRATNTATTYKTEIVRSGSLVSYVVTDLATNREVQKTSLGDDVAPSPDTGSATNPAPLSSTTMNAMKSRACNARRTAAARLFTAIFDAASTTEAASTDRLSSHRIRLAANCGRP
jgi:hypothetical protein